MYVVIGILCRPGAKRHGCITLRTEGHTPDQCGNICMEWDHCIYTRLLSLIPVDRNRAITECLIRDSPRFMQHCINQVAADIQQQCEVCRQSLNVDLFLSYINGSRNRILDSRHECLHLILGAGTLHMIIRRRVRLDCQDGILLEHFEHRPIRKGAAENAPTLRSGRKPRPLVGGTPPSCRYS